MSMFSAHHGFLMLVFEILTLFLKRHRDEDLPVQFVLTKEELQRIPTDELEKLVLELRRFTGSPL